MLVVGSRLRSNETLRYKLKLPKNLVRIDANALAHNRGYSSDYFVQGDALATLHALADQLEGRMQVDPQLVKDVKGAHTQAAGLVDATLGAYVTLKNELATQAGKPLWWVRDITLSNSMWGNRAPMLDNPRAGVHALGGGIGQGLAMAIGVAVANAEHDLQRKTVALVGDGGFMLNVGELACAVQEKANLVVLLMNDSRYGVIRNIQDDIYGGRHCYVDLHTPNFGQFCSSLQVIRRNTGELCTVFDQHSVIIGGVQNIVAEARTQHRHLFLYFEKAGFFVVRQLCTTQAKIAQFIFYDFVACRAQPGKFCARTQRLVFLVQRKVLPQLGVVLRDARQIGVVHLAQFRAVHHRIQMAYLSPGTRYLLVGIIQRQHEIVPAWRCAICQQLFHHLVIVFEQLLYGWRYVFRSNFFKARQAGKI
jgi:transketolase N-terminal domain/subunit